VSAVGAFTSPQPLDAALGYAGRRWFVFPLVERGKRPATRHGLHDATTDLELVERWWRARPQANIGIACGPSGLLVVDLDGDEAQGRWANIAARHYGHEQTVVVHTGKPGGLHVYFAGDGPSSSSRLGAGIDTRGRGGYIVAPPSVHESGRRYRWRGPGTEVAPAPAWLLEALKPPPPAPRGERRDLPAGRQFTSYGEQALVGLVDEMLHTPEGGRNERLVRLAYRAGRLVEAGELDEQVAESTLVRAGCETGLSPAEALATVRRGLEAGRCAGPTARREVRS
jgi:Bifunctional DNA primase/polymerase, N-terminal